MTLDFGAEPCLVGDIIVPADHGSIDEELVERLAEDLRESPHGLLEPILVRWVIDDDRPDGGYVELVSGRQRLEAHKRAGLPTIAVKQFEGDLSDDEAKLADIASDVLRKHLSGNELIDRTVQMVELRTRVGAARVEQAQREIHASADAAVARRDREQAERANQIRLQEIADAEGVDVRVVELRVQWKRDIAPTVWARLDEHKHLQKTRIYKALAAHPGDEARQLARLDQIVADGGKVLDPEKELTDLMRAWNKAAPAVRQKFLATTSADALQGAST
jgi:hypothetical protein